VGSEDAISTAAEMREIADGISGSQFVEIPDCGHMSPMEKPDEVNAAIARFIAGLQ
jgi:pimeloyl-ACP methyl ester carboxylesterase